MIWLDQTHAVDGKVSEFGAQFWIRFYVRNDSCSCCSLARPRHSRDIQRRAGTFVANTIHNIIFNSFYFLFATRESFRLFAQLHSLDQLFKNFMLWIQFHFIFLLQIFYYSLFKMFIGTIISNLCILRDFILLIHIKIFDFLPYSFSLFRLLKIMFRKLIRTQPVFKWAGGCLILNHFLSLFWIFLTNFSTWVFLDRIKTIILVVFDRLFGSWASARCTFSRFHTCLRWSDFARWLIKKRPLRILGFTSSASFDSSSSFFLVRFIIWDRCNRLLTAFELFWCWSVSSSDIWMLIFLFLLIFWLLIFRRVGLIFLFSLHFLLCRDCGSKFPDSHFFATIYFEKANVIYIVRS